MEISGMNGNSPIFQKLISNLSHQNAAIRYHSQFALRRIASANYISVLNEFNILFGSQLELQGHVLNELTYVVGLIKPNDEEALSSLRAILHSIDTICENSINFSDATEISNLCDAFFRKYPDLLSKYSDPSHGFTIIISLAASQFLMTNHTENVISNIPKFFASLPKNPYATFAHARLLASISPFLDMVSENDRPVVVKSASNIVSSFVNQLSPPMSQFIPQIIPIILPLENELRIKYFNTMIEYAKTSNLLISAAFQLTEYSKEEINILLNLMVKSLSVVPYHLTNSVIDDKSINNFNDSVRIIMDLLTPETTEFITEFLVHHALNSSKEQRVGFQNCLTNLVKLKANLYFPSILTLFSKVNSAIEAGSLAELVIAIINNDPEQFSFESMISIFEQCYGMSNDITVQFSLDGTNKLGNSLQKPKDEVIAIITNLIISKYQFSALYFSLFNGYCEENEVESADINPSLLMYYFLFIRLKNPTGLDKLDEIMPYELIDTVEPNSHSEITRDLLNKYGDIDDVVKIICEFMIHLTQRCSLKDANLNTIVCIDKLSNKFESNIDLISDIYAAYISVDCQGATQHMHSFLTSMTKSWFIFSFASKTTTVVNLVFQTLSKLNKNCVASFLPFITEYLPVQTNKDQVKQCLHVLAEQFRKIESIGQEFPPKCFLFDSISSIGEPSDDVFRCLGQLVPIPPMNQNGDFVIIISLVLKSTHVTPDLIFMLINCLSIVENPTHAQLLIEPFLDHLDSDFHFNLLMSMLSSLAGHNDVPVKYPIDIDISESLGDNNGSYDGFLEVMSKTVGLCLPVFEKTHYIIQLVLIIMGRLTQKVEAKPDLSLQDSVKYISTIFNSQCLFTVANLLCENQTVESVMSFLILFSERESELLHCVQQFISSLLQSNNPSSGLVFDANETLAKAAAGMMTNDNYTILKQALLCSKYKISIIEVILENLVEKASLIKRLMDDEDLTHVINSNSPECQFVNIYLCQETTVDIKEWNLEQQTRFLELVENYLPQLNRDVQLVFAKVVTNFDSDESINKSIQIMSRYFKDPDFMSCFVMVAKILPLIIKANSNDIDSLQYTISVAIKNNEALSSILPVLPPVLIQLLTDEEFCHDLLKQKDIQILEPILPLFCAGVNLSPHIIDIIKAISGKEIAKNPLVFINLIEICDLLEIKAVDPLIMKLLYDLMKCGTSIENLNSLIILSYFCKSLIIAPEDQPVIIARTKQLLKNPNDQIQSAGFACVACFPIKTFMDL